MSQNVTKYLQKSTNDTKSQPISGNVMKYPSDIDSHVDGEGNDNGGDGSSLVEGKFCFILGSPS